MVKRFPGNKLAEVIEKYPDVAKHLFSVLAARLDSTDKRFVNMLNQFTKAPAPKN